MQEEKEQLNAAAIATLIVVAILGTGAIILFAYQTWEFVNWLLPADNLLMKILAVICFDIFSYVWLAMRLFLGKRMQPASKHWCLIAGIITFLLSLACSIVQMSIADAERFLTNINPNLVYTGDGFIIFALVVDIVTLLILIDIEWPYISGEKRRGVRQPTVQVQQQQPSQSALPLVSQPPALSPVERQQLLQLAQLLEQMQQQRIPVQEVTGKLEAISTQSSPLSAAPLSSQTDQQSQNGKK